MNPGLAVLLLVAGALQLFLYMLFGRFEASRLDTFSKMAFYFILTWILATALGWWSLVWIVGYPALGVIAHASWCGNHGIDWRTCEPREEYLRLRPVTRDSLASVD
jgi:hypothetical protein